MWRHRLAVSSVEPSATSPLFSVLNRFHIGIQLPPSIVDDGNSKPTIIHGFDVRRYAGRPRRREWATEFRRNVEIWRKLIRRQTPPIHYSAMTDWRSTASRSTAQLHVRRITVKFNGSRLSNDIVLCYELTRLQYSRAAAYEFGDDNNYNHNYRRHSEFEPTPYFCTLTPTLTLTLTLIFQPQNQSLSTISHGHSLYQLWTLWGHSFLSYAVNKQTEGLERPTTPTDIVGVWIISRSEMQMLTT